MDDIDENAHLFNAIQRHASVVVQQSLVEGFGLTVTEAMWKDKAIIASAVGSIKDQIADGEQGSCSRTLPTSRSSAGHWVAFCMPRSSRGG
jgi:glycosyltransferase involved in cell wall biosynthesis